MLKLCPVCMKCSFINNQFVLLYLIVIANAALASSIGRLNTNGHQNGPVEVPKIELNPTKQLGIVYIPDDDGLINRLAAKASEGSNVVHPKVAQESSDSGEDGAGDEPGEEVEAISKEVEKVAESEKKKDTSDDDLSDEEAAKLKPLLTRARLENLLKNHRNRRKPDAKVFQQKAHRRHGWKNYYHKEELGEKSNSQKAMNDKDWKRRFRSYKPKDIGSLTADFSGHKATLVVKKSGKKSRRTKQGNQWKTDDVTDYNEGEGVQLSTRRAKISLNGKDSTKSKVKVGSIVSRNRGGEFGYDDDADNEKAAEKTGQKSEKRTKHRTDHKSDQKTDHRTSFWSPYRAPDRPPHRTNERTDEKIDEEESALGDEDAESKKVEQKSEDIKGLRIASKKPQTRNSKLFDVPAEGHSVPATWLLSQPILQARSRMIKAFLRGQI